MTRNASLLILSIFIIGCVQPSPDQPHELIPRFEQIQHYNYPVKADAQPFKYRLTYYFDNGLPYRWLELDSTRQLLTDYIYSYDENWTQTGAKYIEPGETTYARERVRLVNDSTKLTEWLDSLGNVFYTMTDYLNDDGKTAAAMFKGDAVHGYDTTLYNESGFVERIFFTNSKGKVFNNRRFEYDSTNVQGDWARRSKYMKEGLTEIHLREVHYDERFTTAQGLYYPGVLSTGDLAENCISFTSDQQTVFQTRTSDWDKQYAYLSNKKAGAFTESIQLSAIDSLYNGAISPSGNQIIYCNKTSDMEAIWLIQKQDTVWKPPINLSQGSGVEGGYFSWISENELVMTASYENGNIVKARIENNSIRIIDSLSLLNTREGTEFSPFLDSKNNFIIFTRYLEDNIAEQGFFMSKYKADDPSDSWSNPQKIEELPYGWNAIILNDYQFIYSDGDDIRSILISELDLD